MATKNPKLSCDGLCDTCKNGEHCTDEFCAQHSGNVAKISALQERVGDLEDRDSQVDNLTGRVNILINISLIVIAAIIGDFAHSITVNKKFEARYNQDRLQLKDTIHDLDMKLMTRIDEIAEDMEDNVLDMGSEIEEKIDEMAKETDKRFDHIERELPLINHEVKALKEEHLYDLDHSNRD